MRSSVLLCVVAVMVAVPPGRAMPQAGVEPIAALAWMAGSWSGQVRGVDMEEHWTAPRGGTMVGMHRDVRGGATVAFEYLRIETRDGKLVYLASPGGAPPTAFAAIEVENHRVVFENPTHDFPQRVIYWRERTSLHARIEGRQGGTMVSEEWQWAPGSLRP
jgi:hypothetical protein